MHPQINEWQKTVLPSQSSEEIIGIAKVFSDCSDLWRVVIHILAQQHWVQKNTLHKLESAHSYIRLWADGYGVLSGQFEERLKNSQRAGDLTIRLLQSICRTLTQELTPIVTGISTAASQDVTGLSLTAADVALSSERLAVLVQGDNDSEASEDDESVTLPEPASHDKLLDDIADDLRNDTQCLLDLGTRFEEQVLNPIASEAAADPLNSFDGELSDTFIERIIRLYPRCESNLAGRIGKANWLRFLRIAESKPQTNEGRVIEDRDTDAIHDASESKLIDLESLTQVASIRGKSLFNDSGLGTASHVSEGHPNTVRTALENQDFPLLPEGVAWGEPFRFHLLRDIEPYVCPESACDAPLFASTAQWEKHVDSHHPRSTIWSDSRCRICGEAVSDRAMVVRHLANHMEAIALVVIPRVSGVEFDKVPINDTQEESERSTSNSKQRAQAPKPKVKTGCNRCKPSCGQCTRSKAVCDGYPPPPRSRDSGADSELVKLSSPPSKTNDSKLESALNNDVGEEWFPLFPGTATSALMLDDGDEGVLSTQDELHDHSFDSAFIKPPLPTSTHQHLSDSTNIPHPITSCDSFTPVSEPNWEHLFSLSEQSSATVNNTTRTYRLPDDTTQTISPTHDVSPRRRDRPFLPIILEDPDAISMKRARNTLAARKSRERKAQRLEELEEKIAKLEQERDNWKNVAMKHGAEDL
ncbi:hypothetical protein FHL15_010088 [Xylaria flabelliformis]|uniref:BZIP domain-containing protein n=1 Tax=Xylaria flabelliformis TaxID=2512241 RepID=A0A553HM85_9PEZI|nr:hypothetical protein FHL15_010088 [Xylaria flabelliformis]